MTKIVKAKKCQKWTVSVGFEKIRLKMWFKSISLMVAFCFLLNTIAWSSPEGPRPNCNLAVPSPFPEKILSLGSPEKASEIQAARQSDYKRNLALLDIANYLLKNNLPFDSFEKVIKTSSEGDLQGILLEHVWPLSYLEKVKEKGIEAVKKPAYMPNDGVVVIPVLIDDKKCFIYIAKKGNESFEAISGVPLPLPGSDFDAKTMLVEDKDFDIFSGKRETPKAPEPVDTLQKEQKPPQKDILIQTLENNSDINYWDKAIESAAAKDPNKKTVSVLLER
ncbi:MAG: hypothetical protein WCP55_24290, partial [Lentisphaerota bacterium]